MIKNNQLKFLSSNKVIQDLWLKNILKKNCYITTDENHVRFFKSFKNSFIFLKTKKKILSKKLSSKRIKYIGKNKTYHKEINIIQKYSKKKFISYKKILNDREKKKVIEIASKNFQHSRFHLDDRISKLKSNLIKKKTLENYFLGLRGDLIFVQFYKKKISGFCLFKFGNENSARIDLICVDKKYLRKGLSKDILNYSLYSLSKMKKKKLIVSTQEKNIAAIKLYDSLKFNPKDVLYLYHYIS